MNVEIDVTSIDTNHAERDKHLRGKDFFDVERYPKATFVSTEVRRTGEKAGVMKGNLTLKGVTKPVTIDVEFIGGGSDPWGGYRVGFEGKTTVPLKGFNILYDLGPDSQVAELFLSSESHRFGAHSGHRLSQNPDTSGVVLGEDFGEPRLTVAPCKE